MTGNCSKNISPDGITGMIFASEGIRDSVTLLNGPMGCRFYHSTTASFINIQPILYMTDAQGQRVPVDYNWLDKWFFRQQRVPSTTLDGYDYVYGTKEKVKEALEFLRDNVKFGLLTIVNSPGASLIGDHLRELADEIFPDKLTLMLESPGFSSDYAFGYEEACVALVQQLAGKRQTAEKKEKARPSVNILGLSVWDRYFEGDKQEITRMMNLCGADVNCFLAAGCTAAEVENLPQADLNVVIDPERGLRCAAYMEKAFGIPYCAAEALPVGFAAAEALAEKVCRHLGTDPEPLYEESRRARAITWYKLNSVYKSGGFPAGLPFAVEAPCSRLHGYARFLTEYLGMKPEACGVSGKEEPSLFEALSGFLIAHHAEASLKKPVEDTAAGLVFGDANLIAALSAKGKIFTGIEISLPGMGYLDIVPKTHLGISGGMFLTEQVLNGLMN